MKLFRPLRHAVATATVLTGLLVMTPSLADDIDLYTGGSATTGAASNVLIVLDNSTNWAGALQGWTDPAGKQGVAELETLRTIVGTLSDNVNVGLMTFAQDGNGQEGQVRYHVRPMNDPNRSRLQQILDYMATNAVQGNNADEAAANTDYDRLMNAAFRYYNGKGRYPGINNTGEDRKDHKDNPAVSAYDPVTNPSGYDWAYCDAERAAPAGDGSVSAQSCDYSTNNYYKAPPDCASGCAKNFIIFIGNGLPSNIGSTDELTTAAALINATADTTAISGSRASIADLWARFMYTNGVPTNITDPRNSSQKLKNAISTYTINVCKDKCTVGSGPAQETLLKSMANVGGGKYFRSTSRQEIQNALATIFAEIQAVNSVFASATLPISVNTQGTYENQVYIGVFRPDGSSRQRWYGNLKHYRFGRYCDLDGDDKADLDSTRALPLTGTYSTTDERVADDVAAPDCGTDSGGVKRPVKLYLGDQNGYTAIDESGNTGFIDLSAKSYWTTDSSFWTFLPTASGSVSDSPDGPEVERGGAAQKLRATWTGAGTPDGRKVYTCLGNCLLSSGTATEKTLSSSGNAFSTATSAVNTALAAPSNAAVTVTLARVGNTVTATTGSHSFNTGDAVTISGATPTAYNSPTGGSFTVTTLSSTQFTYPITETPPTSGSGSVGLSSDTTSVTSIVLSSATAGDCTTGACKPGKTVTATMVTSAEPSNPVTVAATGKNYLNVSAQPLTGGIGMTTVTFPVTTTTPPAGAIDLNAGVTAGTWISTGLTGAYDATNNRFSVTATSGTYPNSLKNLTAGASVILSSATEPKYNGTWQLSSNAANTVMTFTYVSYSGCNPCTGATATTTGTTDTITFNRALGSTTLNVTRTTNNIPNGSLAVGTPVNIADAAGNYSGPHVLTANNDGAGTFSFDDNVTLGPVTPATGTISALAVGTSGGPTTANLINWMRGKDLWEDENIDGTGAFSDVRGSIHGDVLHARPVMVNYGGTVGIVGFYGSNDGYLRAIAAGSGKADEPANRTDTHTDDGNEKWAFIPSEFLSYNKLSRAYLNGTSGTSLIRYPNQACGLSTTPAGRDYRWDGPITAYQSSSERVYYTSDPAVATDTEPTAGCSTASTPTCYSRLREVYYTSDPATFTYTEPAAGCSTATPATCYKRPERTWIFASMRRGGRAIYALDVSVADTPKLMWRIDNNGSGFSDLAQTWSEPKVRILKGIFTRADGTTTVKNPVVLIFGSGYHAAVEDQPSGTRRTLPTGAEAGVYVVEAETGQLIKFLLPPGGVKRYSFPADTTPIDMDNDGYVDRIYAGDTDANIFRWNLINSSVTNINDSSYWTTNHVAKLGDVGDNGGDNARKIHFAPEVLPFKLSGVVKVMVLFGTGDREKPLGNLDGSTVKTLSAIGGCADYFTGSNPYPITGSLSGIPYTYFGPRVRDQFFGVVDSGGSTIVEANLQYVNQDSANLVPFDINSTTYRGWRMRLKTDPDGSQGDTRGEEKSVNAAKVVGGVTFFATNVPVTPNTSAGVCSNLGVALGYAVSPFTGMPAINRDDSVSGGVATYTQADYATIFSGGGLPPTVTSGVVTIGGTPYRFIIGSGGSGLTSSSAVGGERSILDLKGTRSRLYWSYGADN